MEEVAKYFVALSKLNNNDEETTRQINSKLIELINEELVACLAIVGNKGLEWGDTAIRVNKIAKEISDEIQKRLKS